MKSEDTVISGHYSPKEFTRIKEQAELSFKAGINEVVEFINRLALYTAETAEEGKPYTYLGSYILKWGREAAPSYGFAPFDESPEWQAKLKEWRL